MKRIVAVLIILLMSLAQATAMAAPPRHDRHRSESRHYRTSPRHAPVRPYGVHREWHRAPYWRSRPVHREYRSVYQWHSPRISHRHSHPGRLIIDAHWNQRFPGYRSYWYEGPGFFYRGAEYRKVVLFYDSFDRLEAFGFWRNGRFVVIRSDESRYVSDDRYFIDYKENDVRIRVRI